MDQTIGDIPSVAIPKEDIVYIALEVGENILKCGGEISRAEDTISRICKAYGALRVDATAILSMIVLTAEFFDGSICSSRRLSEVGSNNLGRLSRLNDLSRRICRERPTKDEFLKHMANINGSTIIRMRHFVLGSMGTAFGYSVFFNNFENGIDSSVILSFIIDAFIAAIIALPLSIIAKYLSQTKTNAVIAKFLVCFIGGVSAILLCKNIPYCHVDAVMIGNIMNFIPGVALTNSFRDLFGGDIMSGVFRFCSVIIDAVAIASGYAVAILILGGTV